jgi:dynein heavy chain
MGKAFETQNVIETCANENLLAQLPIMYIELEKCQKSLEGYLEQKRSKFPRFYFVSNPVLLLILSQGSDPQQMQPYYEKVFDSIDRVQHSKADKSLIVQIQSIMGNVRESITLNDPVKSTNSNIEDWLGVLEKEMQKSLKKLCETAALECISMPLRAFVNKSCGQFALLGLQLSWTSMCQDALSKAGKNKQIIADTNKMQLTILQDLSSWCLEDLQSRMNRVKIETLVTIQVHQRDVFADLARMFKERKISDANDFEWLKQIRFYWQLTASDEHGQGACVISICDVDYKYNNEYLGCKERLVITPLTDRCFITLSQAMGMCLGGAPAGIFTILTLF